MNVQLDYLRSTQLKATSSTTIHWQFRGHRGFLRRFRVWIALVVLFWGSGGVPVLAEDSSLCEEDLPAAIEAIASDSRWQEARWGISVQTLSGRTLYAREADKYFVPASSMKLLTTAAVLSHLGAAYRLRTPIYLEGEAPQLSHLHVEGASDPSLTTAQLEEFARQLYGQGIRSVDVLSVAPAAGTINPTWEWEDIFFYYASAVGGLILNENTATLTLLPGQPGEAVRWLWDDAIAARQWRVENQAATAAPGTAYSVTVSGLLGQPILLLEGELAADAAADEWKIAIRDPAEYFAATFARVLGEAGIAVNRLETRSEPISSLGISTNRHRSATFSYLLSYHLSELLRETNQNSNNLYAEALLKVLAREMKIERAIEAARESLTALGLDETSYRLVDASGLSRHNWVTPEALSQTLVLMAETSRGEVYRDSLAVAGESGTLRNRFRDSVAEGKLWGKTGTLSGVVSLSGYVEVPDYEPLAFSIILERSGEPIREQRQAIDAIALTLMGLQTCQGIGTD